MEKERFSNIELLRVLAAFGVKLINYHDECVALHGLPETNMNILLFMKSIGICSVNIFLLISGFFLIDSEKRKFGKIVSLLFQVSVFNLLFMIGRHFLDNEAITMKNIISQIIPVNYFIILYVALYLISPFINKLLQNLTENSRKVFLFLSLVLFSVYPTILDFTQELRGEMWWGLSTIGAWGNQQGFNIVNFILLYCIGAICKLNNIVDKWKSFKYLIPLLIGIVVMVFLWAYFEESITRFGMRSAWCYHNPLVIFLAVLLFVLFQVFKFKSAIINQLGEAVRKHNVS